MAEPRKVPFVTISSFGTSPALLESKKRRREDEAEITGKDGGVGSAAGAGSGGCVGGLFGNVKGGGDAAGEPEEKPPTTVRLDLSLTEPNERGSAEFNYTELIQSTFTQVKPKAPAVCKGLTPPLDPSDPFADDDRERREVEELAKKFESKYGGVPKKKKRDRMQDLIDIGYGYDETDPFIDNSEAYDELVPASLTTKHGGFYINIGTLQFRPASDSEGEGPSTEANHFKKLKDGEERAVKRRRKKQDGNGAEDKKPRKNRVPKQGVSALNVHRPEKKKRKKLMKDSIQLANMLRRFSREKEELRKKIVMGGVAVGVGPPRPAAANKAPHPPPLNPPPPHKVAAAGNDFGGLGAPDPAVMSLLGAANDNNDMLQDLMGDLDFGMLDSPQPRSPAAAQGENGGGVGAGPKGGGAGASRGPQAGGVLPPPPLPGGLSAPLIKRIEDLRAASRQFDQEGRKKFFTLDMNNILLDIELQVQEQPDLVRSAVYSHLEAFVPCNKEALLKRLKKLSLNIQDDRLRTPLLKLKLAVCSVMPEQIARYNMDCIAKVAKQQSEEGEKNGSEEDDDDKPGKRVMGPRKKFIWDDKLRTLLCNLVRVKLGCYELEGQNSVSPEDYLKAFMETEVKLLWPKGWMQARMLFKESTAAHGHLTGNTAKKKMLQTPKARPKEAGWVQRSTPTLGAVALGVTPPTKRPPQSPSEPIFLDALDEQLAAPSLDSISQALVLLSNAAKGLAHGDSPPSPDASKTSKTVSASSLHASPILQQHKKGAAGPPYVSTSSSAAGPLSRTVSSAAAAHLAPAHRHAALGPPRPATVGLGGGSSPKPRPPPTASPLVAPGSKPGAGVVSALPSGLLKGGGNLKATSGDAPFVTSPPPRSHMAPKTPQTTPRLPQTPQTTPRLPQTPHSKPSLSHPLTQSNFITPMHATLTRTSLSSTPPVIKLTPRTPGPAAPRAALAAPRAALVSQPHPRPQATPPLRQYSPRGPATGFRAPFSGAQGAAVKAVAGSYAGPGPALQKQAGGTGTSLTITSSTSKHSGATPSAATATANAVQRQRSAGGTTQGTKPITSVSSPTVTSQLPQVSSAGGGGLLGSPPSLPLGFGMLGGLVPVSLPFQFPPLLSLPTLGTANAGAGAATSQTANSNASFSTLTQNLYKSLQSGAQVALAPHLQLAFSDVNQSQGGDAAKRKAL